MDTRDEVVGTSVAMIRGFGDLLSMLDSLQGSLRELPDALGLVENMGSRVRTMRQALIESITQ